VPSATSTGTRATTSSSSTHATSNHTPAIVGGVIGGVACLLIVLLLVLFVLYRRRQKEKGITVDEIASGVPAPQIIPPSRLPAKMTEGHSNLRPSPGIRTDPSGLSSVETATQSLITSNQNPSDSPESGDSTDPSSLIVHQDSGARLPRVLPPAYTAD